MPPENDSKTIIIGLSGPSSSGKTTLARLLRQIFNVPASTDTDHIAIRLFILHEDDFYKTDVDIPTRTISSADHGTRAVQDWDCVESLDLPLLTSTLTHVKRHGRLPPDAHSKEDGNSVGPSTVSQSFIDTFHREVISWLDTRPSTATTTAVNVCILDGFLLFPPPPPRSIDASASPFPDTPRLHVELYELMRGLDLKLFLPARREQTVQRRAARKGYVTLEGFWEDPPGYVEEVVWGNYARDHAWLFDGVESVDLGRVDVEAAEREGIVVGPGPDEGMERVVQWGVERVREVVGAVLK